MRANVLALPSPVIAQFVRDIILSQTLFIIVLIKIADVEPVILANSTPVIVIALLEH
jgi:hypothetical protein